MNIKQLPHYEITEEVFNNIILHHRSVRVPDLSTYQIGYSNKKIVYYTCNGLNKVLICKESVLNYYANNIEGVTDWKQCVCTLNTELKQVKKTVSGLWAFNYINKILSEFYSKEEIEDICNSYKTPYDKNLIQVHLSWTPKDQAIYKCPNCYKYDINGAHTDALTEIFPKAKEKILELYSQRKEKPIIKDYFNLCVGYFKHKGYDGMYNYIIQRTTKLLNEAIRTTNGTLLYANTDGFVIQQPKELLNTSKDLGKFKLEHKGDCYIHRGTNYWIYQMEDEIKGNVLNVLKPKIDLRKGIVVDYEKVNVNGIMIPNKVKVLREPIYEKICY